jgi:HEPN domain-containing protein
MKPPEEVKRELVQEWLARAEEDFAVARHLVSQDTPYPSAVGFHAQQAAEKYLKAYLTWQQIEFPKTHDLEELLDLIATVNDALGDSLRETIVLTDYSVDTRYPRGPVRITSEDARAAVELAQKVKTTIREALQGLV